MTIEPTNNPPAPAPDFDWSKQGLETEALGYVQTKGWKNPVGVIESYRNLEKLTGVPPEQIIKLPKGDTPEEWGPVWDRLGRPKDAKGYEIPTPKEGADEKFVEWAKTTFHEVGLPARLAKSLAEKWNAYTQTQTAQAKESYETTIAAETQALKKEWGADHEKNITSARRAAKEFGLDANAIDRLESALGFAGLMKLMHKIGSKLGTDDSFIGADTKNPGFNGMSASAAKAQIDALKADKAFSAKYIAGDVEAREKMTRLHQIAYPDA